VPIPPIIDINIHRHVQRSGGGGFFSRLPGRKGPKKGGKRDLKQMLSYAAVIGAALVLAGTIAVIGAFAWVARDLPDPDNIVRRNVAQTTKIYDRTGEIILYEVHGEEKRTAVELDRIAQHMKDATITAEDRDFYTHKGFKLTGYVRAFYKNLLSGTRGQGGSTITQQFIKNSVLTTEKTYTRKIKELILSLEMERRFSKEQILKLYLNEIPYGSVAYGVESAAQTFFGKPASDLTLSESAVLAALPKAPTYYSPYGTHRDDLMTRAHSILDAMVAEGYITEEERDEAKADEPLERLKPRRENIVAPHFVFYVREILAAEFGEQAVERGGLKVVTTLDAGMQKAAEEAIAENMELLGKWEANGAAMTALDPRTGDILAMVGSPDYFDDENRGKFNAMTGLLQPGSSIKPMIYAAAFEKGFTPSTVVYDVKTEFGTGARSYSPNNYDLQERGPVTFKEALAGSLNIPAVKALYLVGLPQFKDFAERLGYTTFDDPAKYGLSLVLGGAEVRPIEHIGAFAAFAQDGVHRPSRAILSVEDKDGKKLVEEEENAGKRVMDAEVARQTSDILSDNAARAYVFGEQNWLTLGGRPVGAKTGTTNDYKDAWTIGFTPSLVSGFWVGNMDGSKMKFGADGSKVAAPLWNAFMRKALDEKPIEAFAAPQPVTTGKPILDGAKDAKVSVRVDTVTGKLATEHTPEEFVEERGFGVPHSILYFVDKNDPRGPVPADPAGDPQFANWEKAIAEWAEKQGLVAEPPPTEFDDVHVPENRPSVSFIAPLDGAAISDRSFNASVSATALRGVAKVEYLLDGEVIGAGVFSPYSALLTVPNRFGKGFHTLSAKAVDDVGNAATASITINLTADPGPLGIQWQAPWSYQTLYDPNFPFTVRFTIEDHESISELRVTARRQDEGGEEIIGSIKQPPLPGMSMQWTNAPEPGRYVLTVEALLVSGDVRSESIIVDVR
jgi:1A family penicillin-binding protein